jgi:hypothetical protein
MVYMQVSVTFVIVFMRRNISVSELVSKGSYVQQQSNVTTEKQRKQHKRDAGRREAKKTTGIQLIKLDQQPR